MGIAEEYVSRQPAVGSTILLNDMDFKVIGVIPKIGKEGENGTNHRIFVPFDTMRMLFPLKAQNSENAISFIKLPAYQKGIAHRGQERSACHHCAATWLRSQPG